MFCEKPQFSVFGKKNAGQCAGVLWVSLVCDVYMFYVYMVCDVYGVYDVCAVCMGYVVYVYACIWGVCMCMAFVYVLCV